MNPMNFALRFAAPILTALLLAALHAADAPKAARAPNFLFILADDQPVRTTLLIQSSPGRDAFTERDPELPKPAQGAARRTRSELQAARNRAWNEIAKKGQNSGSHGMAHALREGPWKLVFDIEHDQPVALYNLDNDLAEQTNLFADPAQADRVKRMEKLYRDIRGSNRSTPVAGAAGTLQRPASEERQR
jgi:hypothetical protein